MGSPVCNQSCLSSCCPSICPSVLHGKNVNIGQYMNTFQLNHFISANLYLCHCLQPFYPVLSVTLTLVALKWRSQGQHTAKPVGFIFSHTF